MAWAGALDTLQQASPIVSLDKPRTLLPSQAPHLDTGREGRQVFHVCHSCTCFRHLHRSRVGSTDEGLSRPGGGLSAVSTCFQEGRQGCCWVTRTAEDGHGSGQVLHGERGRTLKVGATEEHSPGRVDRGTVPGTRLSGWKLSRVQRESAALRS